MNDMEAKDKTLAGYTTDRDIENGEVVQDHYFAIRGEGESAKFPGALTRIAFRVHYGSTAGQFADLLEEVAKQIRSGEGNHIIEPGTGKKQPRWTADDINIGKMTEFEVSAVRDGDCRFAPSREVLERWGVSWPPVSGWRKNLQRRLNVRDDASP